MPSIVADLILVVHLGYAAFVLGGLLVLPLGLGLQWAWVRTWSFRLSHLACTAIVALEAVVGLMCPLTWLEDLARTAAGAEGYSRSFIGDLLFRLLYYEAPAWVFTVAYLALTLMVLMLLYYAPPVRRGRAGGQERRSEEGRKGVEV